MDQPRSTQSQTRRTSHGDGPATPRTENVNQIQAASVLFREIHKNAWLKKLPAMERRTGAFPKRGERVWVVFCVHDDTEAFLELYSDQKVAVTHKPDWAVSLNNCLHVSPTICAQEDEYEFVVTLSSDVVRLTAPSWDGMMEWVETIGSKLREMRILSPRENLYSKMPEARLPLAPTRDPNSPLPPPPSGPSAVVPGVELTHSDSSDGSSSSGSSFEVSPIEVSTDSSSSDDTFQHHPIGMGHNNNAQPIRMIPDSHVPQPSPIRVGYDAQLIRMVHNGDAPRSRPVVMDYDDDFPHSQPIRTGESSHTQPIGVPYDDASQSQPIRIGHGDDSSHTEPTGVAVGDDASQLQPVRMGCYDNVSLQIGSSSSSLYITQSEPPIYTRPRHALSRAASVPESPARRPPRDNVTVIEVSSTPSHSAPLDRVFNFNFVSDALEEAAPRSRSSERLACPPVGPGHYECVFLPSPGVQPPGGGRSRRRRSSSTSDSSAGGGSRADGERRLQPAPHPYRQGAAESCRLTLREQQVLQLRREMLHPGGVRLQLRRRDCIGSIALIDAFGGIWVAGWKQRERPMLYNALHIGDQLLSVAGVVVQSAADAQKLVRNATSLYVEFVMRRVPFGRVFAVRRDSEGQGLGVVQEGNTAEIRDVLPGSPAARHGLSPRAQTCDGLSLTNWVLTEVNGRPLNLFFKDGEVRDRLNAVGKDISLLVQPFDLVRQLKKQLKAVRGYKEYIVQ